MTAPFILAAYAFFVGALGHRVLRRCAWPERSPRLGILVWQALTASVVLSTVLAGIAMAFSSLPVGWSIDIAWWLHACAEVLREQYSTPGGVALGAAGGVLAAGVPARVGYCLTRTYWSARRSRANQRRALALVARRDETDGFLVVEHPAPLVYCMPGRDREVIF